MILANHLEIRYLFRNVGKIQCNFNVEMSKFLNNIVMDKLNANSSQVLLCGELQLPTQNFYQKRSCSTRKEKSNLGKEASFGRAPGMSCRDDGLSCRWRIWSADHITDV